MCQAWEIQFEQLFKRPGTELALFCQNLRLSYDFHRSSHDKVAGAY